ncbi:MAG: hypothetical protein ER33_14675 [Cyanobium sp. CACIAM 14]|nr:MAG: hypothetical protein ER33_14675 [Cyanobium sp. CACIAM 14]
MKSIRGASRRVIPGFAWLPLGLLLLTGCDTAREDFRIQMGEPLPAGMRVLDHAAGSGFGDPWSCWELAPVNTALVESLRRRWQLRPDPQAFPGVISGGTTYCSHPRLDEAWSGQGTSSRRAVGIDRRRGRLVVSFYNG